MFPSISGFSGLMVLLIRFLASVIVWVILAVAIVASIGKSFIIMKTVIKGEFAIDHNH